MTPRRIYPSWLPPTWEQRQELVRIRRLQALVLIWFVSFIPAGWVVVAITRSDAMFVPLTVFWVSLGVILARRVTDHRCPRCGANFCDRTGMPYIYGLFNSRCESCGLTLHPDHARGG